MRIVSLSAQKILEFVPRFAETEFPAAVSIGNLAEFIQDMRLSNNHIIPNNKR